MVATGTIPLLSACKFLYSGKELAQARNHIRLSIGCLKAFAEIWPRGAKNLNEIQAIARHVLAPSASKPANERILNNGSNINSNGAFASCSGNDTQLQAASILGGGGGPVMGTNDAGSMTSLGNNQNDGVMYDTGDSASDGTNPLSFLDSMPSSWNMNDLQTDSCMWFGQGSY